MDDAGLRIMLSAAVIICCSYAGKAVSSRNTRRMKLLANIMDAMQMLRIHMLDNLLPLSAALEKSECILFKNISHALSEGGIKASWSKVAAKERGRGGYIDALTDDDISVLSGFINNLGTTAAEEQRSMFDTVIKELGVREAAAREECTKKNRLYIALGGLAGAAIVVSML